jgi:ABC-type proline/glycine betaine transport system substrate-binding protein
MPKMQHLTDISLSGVTSRRTFLKVGAGATALATAGLTTSARADSTRPIVYAHAAWSDALAITFVGAKLIEDHFGYKVQPLQADVAVIYASLQSGKADLYSNFHVVNKDFKSNFPKAHQFLTKFHIPNDEEAKVMSWIDDGMAPKDAAAKWVDATKGKGIVEEWLS